MEGAAFAMSEESQYCHAGIATANQAFVTIY
jgi:hypothetical protein